MADLDDFKNQLAKIVAGQSGGGGSSSSASSAQPEPNVWWQKGKTAVPLRPKRQPLSPLYTAGKPRQNFVEVEADIPKKAVAQPDEKKTLSDAQYEFFRWDQDKLQEWGDYLVQIGYLDDEDSTDYTKLKEAWLASTQEASTFDSAGVTGIDPWAAARKIAGTDSEGKTAAGRERGFTGTKRQVATTVDLTDPTTAKGAINQTLARLLGRNANPEEVSAFTATLNQAERDNPTVATTVGTYADGELTDSKTTSTGGVDGGQVLEDKAMDAPDYGAYQAGSTYYNALLSAIASPV